MFHAAIDAKIPLVIGTCGGAGGAPHLDLGAGMARKIARQDGHRSKLAMVRTEQSKDSLKRRVGAGQIKPLANQASLTEATVDRAERIVALMGPEPIAGAPDEGAQVVLAGRASDPASWANLAIRAQIPPAPSWYGGPVYHFSIHHTAELDDPTEPFPIEYETL